jgi:hypothetical protein
LKYFGLKRTQKIEEKGRDVACAFIPMPLRDKTIRVVPSVTARESSYPRYRVRNTLYAPPGGSIAFLISPLVFMASSNEVKKANRRECVLYI